MELEETRPDPRNRDGLFFSVKRLRDGLSYPDYVNMMKKAASEESDGAKDETRGIRPGHPRINYQRTARILKAYRVTDELRMLVLHDARRQIWMALSETWCGDSAQCLPYIYAIAQCSPMIEFRVLLRDQNLDIMDRYLTNGTRGIPKVVAFGTQGEELFRWGPRPREAQALFLASLAEGFGKEKSLQKLHLWYGRDRGRTLEGEFLELFRSAR